MFHRPPPFSFFLPIYRFCHPVLPSLKQYTCSAALFFQSLFLYTGSPILFYHLLNSIHVPPPPFFKICFLYTGSAILFYYLLSSIHVPPPPFSIFFFLYTGSAILFYHLLSSIHVQPPPFFNLFSYIQVLPSCFTIF